MMKLDTSEMSGLTLMCAAMPGINMKARNSAMGSIGFALKAKAKKMTNNPNGLPEWPQIKNISKMSKVVKASPKPRPYKWFTREESWEMQEQLADRKTWPNIGGKGSIILNPWGGLASALVYAVDEQSGDMFFGFKAGIFGTKVGWTNAPSGTNGQWGKNNVPGAVTRIRRDNVISERLVNICKQLTEGYTYSIRSAKEQRYYAALGFVFQLGYTITTPARPLVGPVFRAFQPEIPALFESKFWASMRRNMYPETAKIMDSVWGRK